MKKVFLVVMVLAISLVSCHGVAPDAGEEAVLIKKPWIFGSGGVEPVAVKTDLTWCFFSTSSETFNIKPVLMTETFDDVITSDNVPVDFQAYISLRIIEGETPILYENFGVGWYDNNVKEPFRTLLRNYSKKQKLFELTTDASILETGEIEVEKAIKMLIKEKKIPVEVIKVTIGKISPPDDVTKETTKTAAEKQKTRTNVEREIAEKSRAGAEKQSAIADKAYQKEFGMTVNQYLEFKKLELGYAQLEVAKLKGSNVSMIFNDGAIPTVPIK